MGLVKGLRDVVGFLTIIPVKLDENSLQNAANYMFLFPVVGAFLGILADCFACLLLKLLPTLVVGALTIFFLLTLTGFHHLDGLLDFGDGLMFQGTREEKINVMRDSRVGVGGMGLGLMVTLTTLLCVSELVKCRIFYCLTVSECLAKLSMVFLAFTGRSACEGLNTYFVNVMHGKHRILRLAASVTITSVVGVFLMGIIFVYLLLNCVVTSLVVLFISNKHFNGITGDVLGALNEFSRMTSLLVMVVIG
ncbi:MAG: adenosylcobinamide-GDP ribazoletransferase [Candidatus Bathyarchaeota archaeon]|nr:adenosylcobinamide-GDP ribazoletransferase [Candidatus Bathyarchaeota archaeon]